MERVKNRLRGLLGAGGAIILLQLVFDPGGITGALLTLWFLVSLPLVAVTVVLLAVIREPSRIDNIRWDRTLFGAIGLVLLAELIHTGRDSAVGRALWQLLFGEANPDGDTEFVTEESSVDQTQVDRIRRYVQFAIIASLVVAVLEPLLLGTSISENSAPTIDLQGVSGPAEVTVVGLVALSIGLFIGLFLAVWNE